MWGRISTWFFLVTASPFQHNSSSLTLLTLEDMSELAELRQLIPICASCKKIRNDKQYWEHLETYLKKHMDLDFTHTVCPECAARLYPEMQGRRDRQPQTATKSGG